MRWSRAALAGSLLALTVLATASAGAQPADETEEEPSGARLRLVEQDAWVGPTGTFDLRVRVDGAPVGARLAVEVYPAVRSRTAFARSVDGEDLGTPLRPLPADLPLDALARDPDGSVPLTFPVSTGTPPPLGLRVTGQGVYPVRVSLVGADDEPIDDLITHLVRLPDAGAAARALAFSLVVPVAGGPGFGPDGQAALAADDLERIGAAVDALAAEPTVPATVDAVPETLDSLSSTDPTGPELLGRLQGALGVRQVLGRTYAPLELGAWVASPDPLADEELTRQATTGNEVTTALLGRRPDRRTSVVDRSVTEAALTRLDEVGVDQLVVPEDQLGPLSGQAAQVTFTQRFEVRNGAGRAMPAVAADAVLADRLTATDDPVLNGHLVIADLAVLFFDRPNIARGAVLVVPPTDAVDEQTYATLLAALTRESIEAGMVESGHQIVAPVTLDDLFDLTDPATTGREVLVRPYRADAPAPLGPLVPDIQQTRARIGSYASLVDGGSGMARVPLLDRQVLIASRRGLDDTARRAYLDGVSTSIDEQLAGIVTPQDQQVTLTDRAGDIPITIENTLDYPVEVEVVLRSAKLEFPDGATRTVTLPAATPTQVDVAVEAKASGAFPVDVTVRTPDGNLVVGTGRYTVRSTAISGVGLVLSVGAGLFLLLWWARHWRTVRRDRRLVSTAHPAVRSASETTPSTG